MRELLKELSSILSEIEELEQIVKSLENSKGNLIADISAQQYRNGLRNTTPIARDVYVNEVIELEIIKGYKDQIAEKKGFLRENGFDLDLSPKEK